MITNIIQAIKEQAEHIEGIKSFKYEGNDMINQQHNNSTVQVIVEDDIFSDYDNTKDLLTIELNIDILDILGQDKTKLEVHDKTFKIGIVLMKLISFNYRRFINVKNLSMLTLSNYTDDDLFGQRLSMTINIPSPITNCNINDFINMNNKYDEYIDNNISINNNKINIDKISLNPIKLK